MTEAQPTTPTKLQAKMPRNPSFLSTLSRKSVTWNISRNGEISKVDDAEYGILQSQYSNTSVFPLIPTSPVQDNMFNNRNSKQQIDEITFTNQSKHMSNPSKLGPGAVPTLKASYSAPGTVKRKDQRLSELDKVNARHITEMHMTSQVASPKYYLTGKPHKNNEEKVQAAYVQNVKTFLSKTIKTLNSQEKLDLLKRTAKLEEKQTSHSTSNSRFNFYYVDEKAIKSHTQSSNLKNIHVLRKYNKSYERSTDKYYTRKAHQLAQQTQYTQAGSKSPQKGMGTDNNWFRSTSTDYKSNFVKFPKLSGIEHGAVNPTNSVRAMSMRAGQIRMIEENMEENEKPGKKILEEQKDRTLNKNALYKYLKLFSEMEIKSYEFLDHAAKNTKEMSLSIEADSAWQEKSADYGSIPNAKIPLDYSHMRHKKILLSILKEQFPEILLRPNGLGEKIMTCLGIDANSPTDVYLGFEKFHNFARFALFYDATFVEMVEFVVYFLIMPYKACTVGEFKGKLRELMQERYSSPWECEKAMETLVRQYEMCSIFGKDEEFVNLENFKRVYASKKLNIHYLMDLIMNRK